MNQYPLQTFDKVRYADTDRQGHVNNSVFNQYFETGRVELLYHPEHPMYSEGCAFVIVSSNVEYLHEIQWPGLVQIGTAVQRIGTSSIHFVQSLFQENILVAQGDTIIVQVDRSTTSSSPLNPKCRAILQKYLIEAK